MGPASARPLQHLSSVGVRQLAGGVTVEPEHVEEHADDRTLGRELARHRCGADLHARLELLEARTALVVEGNDFAVEHHVGLRERIAEGA